MKKFNFKLFIFCFAVFSLAGIAQLHAKVVTNDECIEDVHVSDADNKSMYNMMAGTNLAIAGTATQSSTRFGGVASRAIDGNTDGTYNNNSVTSTDETTTTEYWDLDLGQLSSIEEIIFYNRTDCCSDRISQVYVLVANTPFPTDVNDLSGALANADFTFQFANGESSASVTIPVNVSGRYVRLQKSGSNISNFLSIAELEVHGVDSDNDNVLDVYDLDTDNDGILDVDEKSTTSTIEAASWSNGTPTTADGLMSNGDVNLNLELTKTDDDATTTSSNSFGTSDDGNRGFNIRIRNGVIFNLHFALGSIAELANIGHFRLILADGSVISNPSVTISQTSTFSTIDYSTAFPGNTDNLVETIINGDKYYTDTGGTPQASGFLLLDNSVQNLINDGGGVVRIRYRQRSTQPDTGNIFGTSVYGTYQAERDTDNDGIPDHLDLDSDNDGVYDAIEAGASSSQLDANGRLTGGTNTDGVPTAANSGAGYTLADTDSNGVFNPYDLDSDGDGCSDANEYYLKADADGRDGGEYGVGTPGVNASTGVVTAAAYDGTTYADALDNTITRGCQFIQTTTGNWNTTTNWEARTVPILTDDATINDNVRSTVTTNQAVNNLILDPGSEVIVKSTMTLNVKGNITNNGNIIKDPTTAGTEYSNLDGEVVLDGNASQSLSGVGEYYNLRLNNTAGADVISSTVINGILYVDQGDFNTNNNTLFPCDFTAANRPVGQIGPVLGTITGSVSVEQCFPARRAFRFVSATTTGSTIKASWQEGTTSWNDASVANNYGTHITGVEPSNPTSNPAQSLDQTNGFDWQPSGDASMFSYNESTKAWEMVPNTTASLTAGDSYRLMIRGARKNSDVLFDLESNAATPTDTKLRSTGTAPKGPIGFSPSILNGEFAMVGNPFHAAVNMNSVLTGSGFTGFFYVWDPTLGGVPVMDQDTNGGRGAYVTVNAADGSSSSTSEIRQYIQPYQAFFVQASQDNPSLTFEESDKEVRQDQVNVFKAPTASRIHMVLYDQNSYKQELTADDGLVMYFSPEYSNAVDVNDAPKFFNLDESLARKEKDSYISYERRALPQEDEVLPLFTTQYRATDYVFEVEVGDFPNTSVYLVDNYTATETLLPNTAVSNYSFSVDKTKTGSTASDRFSIAFKAVSLSTDEFDTQAITVYPNPVKDVVNVSFSSTAGEDAQVQILDLLGRQVYQNTHQIDGSGKLQITDAKLSQGVYILKISDKNNQIYTHKILKQ